jgi:hypothetical protein
LGRPGRLSPLEPVVHAMQQWVLDNVLGGKLAQRSNGPG